LVSISTTPPNIKKVLKFALAWKQQQNQILIELIGRKIKCKTGTKIIYNYADYRSLGMRLPKKPKVTLSWLLNTLNKDFINKDLKQPPIPLVAFKQKSFLETTFSS